MNLYPMTAGQDIILFQQKFSLNKAISNINMLMTFEFSIDDDLMKQALMLALLRTKAATARMKKQGKSTLQYFSQAMPEGVSWVDLSHLSPEAAETEIESWGQKKFPQGNYDTQLYRVKLIVLPSNERAVYFCVSHLIFDAFALIATAQEMIEIYRSLITHAPLPKAVPSPLPVMQKEWDYLDSDEFKKDYAFFLEYFKDEPEFHSLNGKGSKEYKAGKRYGTVIKPWLYKAGFIDLKIPKHLVQGIEQKAYQNRVPVQTYYTLALRNYLAKIDDSQDITMNHTVARRGSLASKRAGGTMVSSVMLRLQLSNDLTLNEALNSIALDQMRLYRHTDLPYTYQQEIVRNRFKFPQMGGYSSVGLTFQPYSVCQYEDMPIRLKRYNNGYGTMPLYITIMATDNSGDLWSNYEYVLGYIKEESIYRFHRYMLGMFEHLIENSDVTLKDLVDLAVPTT